MIAYRLLRLAHEALSRKLKLPYLHVDLVVESFLDGRPHQRCAHPSRTWNRNFWNLILAQQAYLPLVVTNFGAGYISLKQTSGTVAALTAAQTQISNAGLVNNSNYGLLAGRGSAAEDFEGYALNTPITHGTGANQLSHRAATTNAQAYTGGSKTWDITLNRLFDNLSGNPITVTESAIVVYTTAGGLSVMTSRDLLASSVEVLNNGVLSITYPLSLVYPA